LKLICAIDLLEGRAVRLVQGDRATATAYADDPRTVVDRFLAAGVTMMHVVDLDGAFGDPPQSQLVAELVARAHAGGAKVETGGGLRDADAVDRALATGADWAVVGTLALRDPATTAKLCAKHRQRIVIAADAREGMVAVDGWQTASKVTTRELALQAQAWGAAAILHTDIGRDGLQGGPAVEATAALQAEVAIDVYASGGVGTLADLDACKRAGVRGVVVGRAIYESSFSLEQALERC
jgi:phosphoribosylformimino-5-aminoimidazole carboxamide ribotide isomerase